MWRNGVTRKEKARGKEWTPQVNVGLDIKWHTSPCNKWHKNKLLHFWFLSQGNSWSVYCAVFMIPLLYRWNVLDFLTLHTCIQRWETPFQWNMTISDWIESGHWGSERHLLYFFFKTSNIFIFPSGIWNMIILNLSAMWTELKLTKDSPVSIRKHWSY